MPRRLACAFAFAVVSCGGSETPVTPRSLGVAGLIQTAGDLSPAGVVSLDIGSPPECDLAIDIHYAAGAAGWLAVSTRWTPLGTAARQPSGG